NCGMRISVPSTINPAGHATERVIGPGSQRIHARDPLPPRRASPGLLAGASVTDTEHLAFRSMCQKVEAGTRRRLELIPHGRAIRHTPGSVVGNTTWPGGRYLVMSRCGSQLNR